MSLKKIHFMVVSWKVYTLSCFICLSLLSPKAFSQDALFEWVNQNAGIGANTSAGDVYKPKTIVTDNMGNIYNTGNFTGLVDFNRGTGVDTLNSLTHDQKRFITKTDNDGNLIWVKHFGNDASFTNVTAISVDSVHNIYLGGYFQGTFDMDPGPGRQDIVNVGSSGDIFIIKLDSAGNYIWGKHIAGPSDDKINGLVVSPDGDIFATGRFSGAVDFDPGANEHFLYGGGAFALHLNTNGEFQWATSWRSSEGYGIDIDADKNVYVGGNFSGRVDFDTDTAVADTFFIASYGNMDIFISKFDVNGEFQWAGQIGGVKQDQCFSVAVDKESGDVYATGIFADTADFNPGTGVYQMVSETGGSTSTIMEVYVVKLDTDGNFSWARQLNGTASNWGYSIAKGTGKFDGVYSTGVFRGTADFYQGDDTLSFTNQGGTSEAFLIKIDTAGRFSWSKQLGATVGGSVALDPNGNIFVAGWFNSLQADFDPGEDTFMVDRIGTLDGYVLKLRRCELEDTISFEGCRGFEFMGNVYTESGLYTLPNPEGCDSSSIIVLDLTIHTLDPIINVEGFILGTTQPYDTYQWLLNGAIIPGATNRNYEVVENGAYQVVVTGSEFDCVDTSEIYPINNVSVNDINGVGKQIRIYPNPTSDLINIDASVPVNISLSSVDGRIILNEKNAKHISLNGISEGLYLLNIYDQEGRLIKVSKISKK